MDLVHGHPWADAFVVARCGDETSATTTVNMAMINKATIQKTHMCPPPTTIPGSSVQRGFFVMKRVAKIKLFSRLGR